MNHVDTDHEDKPIEDIRIINTQVIINPFEDVIVRSNVHNNI